MFGKRCTLCGGKLENNVCTLCGLDNSRTDKNYKLNVSPCDDKPMTHIHKEIKTEEKKQNNMESSNRKTVKPLMKSSVPKSSRGKSAVVSGVIIIVFLFIIGNGAVSQIFRALDGSDEEAIIWEEDSYYDEYGGVTRELSDSGETYSVILDPGTYIVGTHIPEGSYTVEMAGEYGNFQLDDSENSIYLWENFYEDGAGGITEKEDVRCYTGAKIEIGDGGQLEFYSENAQTEEMTGVENPLREIQVESVSVRDGYIAGEDFPAGTYDILMKEGSMGFEFIVPGTVIQDEEADYISVTQSFWIDTYKGGYVRNNIYLPEGTEILVDGSEETDAVTLIPSAIIPESYEGYYYIYESGTEI